MSGVAARFAGRIGGFALDVAFDLPASGVTALAGPSGSGKTSVLRCLAGLERIAGELTVGGATWQDAKTFLPAHRRRVGYVFQGGGLLPHKSVRHNLAYAEARSPERVDTTAIVASTGIAPLLDRAPATLSGGEAQRAGLARALVSAPRLLLLDEPLSALGGEAKAELIAWLARLLPGLGVPVVLVTHDLTEADALAARRRITMHDGRIVA